MFIAQNIYLERRSRGAQRSFNGREPNISLLWSEDNFWGAYAINMSLLRSKTSPDKYVITLATVESITSFS